MTLNRNKLYSIIFIGCLAGYIWLYYVATQSQTDPSVEACFIKHTLNIPCPSCGSTRSIISLTKGHFTEALLINPLGYLITIILLVSPLWMVYDIITKRKTLFEFYEKMEYYLRKPVYAIPLIFIVIINWIWNITKEL
ncbi:DUF2752 domain-containing protein [Flavobacterium sufflavum]|uniref:DUF2752 domain-containing protein n=1 Tax=Flavobacterium sufflavum TaxID=1921138 RepID=A0A437KMC5_9FLAO|nr:DUF2752 domain-containing protein [Flavobacterium sufflavum]RVT72331.1 DUF2752 domain-containing protein [Flavobacterium sufflavum]